MNKRIRTAGFTLIELLVVMAITSILLGLIFGPMIQGFNLTNRARVQVLAQDSARQAMELAQRDMSNAVYVFHHLPDPATQLIAGEAMEANAVSIWVRDSAGAPQRMLIPYGMMDFVPPARVMDQNIQLTSNNIDPTTGLAIQRGDVALPLAPGRTITRYWLGLRNNAPPNPADPSTLPYGRPAIPYGNFYENPRERGIAEHNPVALFRAVVSPHMPNLDTAGNPQPDLRLFRVDANNQPIMYDPNFFYDNTQAGNVQLPNGSTTNRVTAWRDLNGDGLVQISENWRAIATPMVPVDRADLVIAERDDNRQTLFFATGAPRNLNLPRLAAQCKFQPTYVGNDAGTPSAAGDVNNEAPSVPPSAFRESSGHWSFPYRVFVYRSPLTAPQLNYFEFAGDIVDEGNRLRFNIREKTYDTTTSTVTSDLDVAYRVDETHYRAARLQLANGERPNILFNVDDRRGIINFAVPHSAVTGWIQDSTGQWKEVAVEYFPDEPNQRWANLVGLGEDGFRYVSLADHGSFGLPAGVSSMPTSYLRQSPLEIMPDGRRFIPNVSIVPGSETVIGPDMRQGPHLGKPITYSRVPRSNDPLSIGPNEYMINYTDILPLPPGATTLPAIQRMGTIIFDSNIDRPGEVRHSMPIADVNGNRFASNIFVTYKIQNNLLSDIVKADYLTRELMTVGLGIRLFEFNSGQPQQVTLTQKIKVRNLQR